MPGPPPHFPFFRLPTEIRNMIYRLLMVHPTNLTGSPLQVTTLSSQLLRTCRAMYREGLHFLYGENTWNVIIYTTRVTGVATQSVLRKRYPLNNSPRPSYTHVRRVHVIIRHILEDQYGWITFKWSIGYAVEALSQFQNLSMMRLEYQLPRGRDTGVWDCDYWQPWDRETYRELDGFQRELGEGKTFDDFLMVRIGTCARNVKRVEFGEGPSPECAEFLRKKWQGDEPRDYEEGPDEPDPRYFF